MTRQPSSTATPLAVEEVAQQFDRLAVVAWQDREHLHNRYPCAEAAMGLRHLEADRPTADDDQVADRFGVVEQGLVGEIGYLVQARYRRHQGAGAGGDDEAPRANPFAVHGDGSFVGESGLALDHPDAEGTHPRHRVLWLDGADHAPDVVADRTRPDFADRGALEPEAAGPPRLVGGMRGGDQRLGGHAAEIQTVAAHSGALDQYHRGPHPGGAHRDGEAAGTGADHADIDLLAPRQRLASPPATTIRSPDRPPCPIGGASRAYRRSARRTAGPARQADRTPRDYR